MTDAEQIDAWREQFESEFDGGCQKYDSGIYRNSHRESMWQGFLIARRSQPVIELSEPDCHCFDDDTKKDVWSYMPNTVFKAITAAGYKYKVKE